MASRVRINSTVVQNCFVPVTLVVAWEVFGRLGLLPRHLSVPSSILAALWELAREGELLTAILTSIYTVALGFALGTCAGIVVGLGAGLVPGMRYFFDPLVAFLYPIP